MIIKKIHKIWELKVINENPNLKIKITQNKNLTKIWSGFQVPVGTTPCNVDKRSQGGSRRRGSSMLEVRCTAVESNFCSLSSSIMLFGGAGGMKDVGRLTGAVDPSSTVSLFSINLSCSL